MQRELRAWLAPPDCCTNHHIACKTQHDGTGTWFIHCSKFREWKKNGSLLWISGNRTLLPPILPDGTLISSIPQLGPVKALFGTQIPVVLMI